MPQSKQRTFNPAHSSPKPTALEAPPAAELRRAHAQHFAVVALAVVVLAACSLAILLNTIRYGVNVPFWDEWSWVAELRDFHHGTKSWLDLLTASSGEHLVATQILYVALAWHITAMNLRTVMMLNWSVALGFCILSAWLTARELGYRSIIPWVVLGASGFLVFNPAAYQLWLWAFPPVYVIPYFLLVIGVLVIQSRLGHGTKLLAAGLLAIAGTFTGGNGLLLWLVLPALFCRYHGVRALKTCRAHGIAFGALLCIVAAAYFVLVSGAYKSPAPPGTCSGAAIAWFFLAYTGNLVSLSLSPHPVFLAQGLGVLLIALFSAALYYEFHLAASLARRRVALIWALVGGLSLFSGVPVAFMRCSFGPSYPLEASRYALASAFFPIAVVVLSAMALEDLTSDGRLRLKPYSLVLSLLSVVAFIALSARYQQTQRAEALVQNTRFSELEGKVAALALTEVSLPAYRQIFPREDHAEFASSVEFLNRKGWLHPPLWGRDFVRSLPAGEDDQRAGYLDKAEFGKTGLELTGWAYLPDRRERAHGVIITASAAGETPKIVGVTFTSQPRPDVYAAVRGPDAFATGWTISIPRDRLPAGAAHVIIRCYGYDAETGRAHLLPHPRDIALPSPAPAGAGLAGARKHQRPSERTRAIQATR